MEGVERNLREIPLIEPSLFRSRCTMGSGRERLDKVEKFHFDETVIFFSIFLPRRERRRRRRRVLSVGLPLPSVPPFTVHANEPRNELNIDRINVTR